MSDVDSPQSKLNRRATNVKTVVLANPNNIRVAVRIRPFNAKELSEGLASETVLEVQDSTVVTYGEFAKEKRYNFDSVFKSVDPTKGASQADVFQELGIPILENALDAYNGCIMAYGQTGSGKSHSVLGDPASEKEKGLLPRSCERLFEMIEKQKEQVQKEGTPLQTTVLASYLEIYQEKMYDLLVNTRTDLQVRLHPTLGPHVPGLIQSPVTTSHEVHELLDFGAKNRAVGATSMNANSSRSHAIFTLDIRLSYSGATAKDLQSCIHFVDLAGSEKQKKTHASGERLQEGIAINQSLSSLSRVIQALSGSSGIQPVFRESKLTLLLKEALSGNSRTVLLACVSPARSNFDESVSTLEFAARCKLIKTNAKKNEQDKRELIETLSKEKEEVEARLEAERQQKLLLQHELEREMEESKKNQELAQQMQEEKQRIEDMLRTLKIEQEKQKEVSVQQSSGPDTAEMERELQHLREVQRRETLAQKQLEVFKERELSQQKELERIQQSKAEELSQADKERQAVPMELQEKLQAVEQREEEERQRMEAARITEVELRQRIEQEMKRVQHREEDLKKELVGLEGLRDSWDMEKADIEQKAQEHKLSRERLLKELGISGIDDLEDAEKVPRLVNMNPDKSLEGCLIFYLPLEETRIGADHQKCQVFLTGLDVAEEVCVIHNEGHEKLEVRPCPGGLVRVNGYQVDDDEGRLLESGDRLAIGRAHIFRVVIPASTSAENVEEEDFEKAMKELQANREVDPRYRRAVDAAVMIVKHERGTKEANSLLESAKAASEVVAEANAILKKVPQEWTNGVSHYELAVLFQADGPPEVCVVARPEEDETTATPEPGSWQERGFSAGIWEAGRFEEDRLTMMHEAADLIAAQPNDFMGVVTEPKESPNGPNEVDWELHAWTEVSLDSFKDLSDQLKEIEDMKKKDQDERKQDGGGLLDWLGWARKKPVEELKGDVKEIVQATKTGFLDWFMGAKSDKEEAPLAKSKANPKKARERREASEPLKSRRMSMAPRQTLQPGALQVPMSVSPTKRSSSSSTRRISAVANAKEPSPKGKWVPPEDLLAEKFGDDILVDASRLEAGAIRRASKSGIETITQELIPDDRETVQIEVNELFGDKLGVRLRMEGLVVSNFDVPEAADVGWRFGDEIVAVNGKAVASREDFRKELAEARALLPILFTVKRPRRSCIDIGRKTISNSRDVGQEKEKRRKGRASSTSVPYREPRERIMDTE